MSGSEDKHSRVTFSPLKIPIFKLRAVIVGTIEIQISVNKCYSKNKCYSILHICVYVYVHASTCTVRVFKFEGLKVRGLKR